jgi:hypothetical protein
MLFIVVFVFFSFYFFLVAKREISKELIFTANIFKTPTILKFNSNILINSCTNKFKNEEGIYLIQRQNHGITTIAY